MKTAVLSAFLVLWLCPAAVRGEPVSMEIAVNRLTRQGETVIYSDDLIEPETVIDLAEPSLPALRAALLPLGLILEPVGDHWVVSREYSAARDMPRLRIRSSGGLALRHLRVDWQGQAYALDAEPDGTYPVPLRAGAAVIVSADGHQPLSIQLPERLAEVELAPVPVIESVIVTGTRHRLAGRNVTGSLTSLTADDLAAVPSLGGDAMRATAALPGMSSVGVSAKPWIRGGLQDELLVRVDGVELLDAYHLADFQSMFSIVDDRSVAAVDVYTGGFPARYGNRMSGSMESVTGGDDSDPHTEIGISLFSLLVNGIGGARDGNTRVLGSLRRGNLDQVLRVANSSLGTPRYYDVYGRIDHRLSERARMAVGALLSKDDVSLEEDETEARSDIDSRYLWNRLELDHGGGLTSANTLTYTWSEHAKAQYDLDDDSGAGGFLDYRQKLWKLGARTEMSLDRQGMRMEFGAQAEYGQARYDSTAAVDRGIIGEVLGGEALAAHDIHIDPDGWSGGVYWAGEFPLSADWLLQPGIRWDFQDYEPGEATDQVSPRLGIRYQPADALTLRLDLGRFYQPQALHELQVADGESRMFAPQRADHYIAGIEWQISPAWEVGAEVYEKRYQRTRQRFENVFNPFVLVPELEPDRVALAPERSKARGVDVEFTHWLSERAAATWRYSYMDAEDRIDDGWVPRRWSQRHTAYAMVSWHGDGLNAAVALTWHSGWRGASLPASIATDEVLDTATVVNSVELDDFVSVDVSLRRTWRLGRSQVTALASITNLTDRDNLAGIEYDAQEEDGLYVFESEEEKLLPLVPSVGVLITF